MNMLQTNLFMFRERSASFCAFFPLLLPLHSLCWFTSLVCSIVLLKRCCDFDINWYSKWFVWYANGTLAEIRTLENIHYAIFSMIKKGIQCAYISYSQPYNKHTGTLIHFTVLQFTHIRKYFNWTLKPVCECSGFGSERHQNAWS